MHHTGQVLDQESAEFRTLERCWECLSKERPFVTVVTSAFPAAKEESAMLKELQEARFFDSFLYMLHERRWACFSCAHPDKVR